MSIISSESKLNQSQETRSLSHTTCLVSSLFVSNDFLLKPLYPTQVNYLSRNVWLPNHKQGSRHSTEDSKNFRLNIILRWTTHLRRKYTFFFLFFVVYYEGSEKRMYILVYSLCIPQILIYRYLQFPSFKPLYKTSILTVEKTT